jgi:hypothetical protein
VFFDEFDTKDLDWLKHFLVPMREGIFQWKGSEFPVGRSVFFFAGGTRARFSEFDQGEGTEAFRARKGPDFVSRLSGYIDIKGINPPEVKKAGEISDHGDTSYIIRRALLLRRAMEKKFPQIIDPESKEMAISTSVVRAFLLANKFLHGGRSLDSIVAMSHLHSGPSFGPSDLPAHNLIRMQASDDFLARLAEPSLSAGELEQVAAACHRAFCAVRTAQGWTLGPRDDKRQQHPLLKPYAELDEAGKQRNRASARGAMAHLFGLGLRLRRAAAGKAVAKKLSAGEKTRVMRTEHDRWLRELLLQGWSGAKSTIPALRINQDIVPNAKLRKMERSLDIASMEATLRLLKDMGYSLVKGVRQPAVDDAIALAVRAHRGQKDKRGEPYLLHVLRVMLSQKQDKGRLVGVLHDSLEDTSLTMADLRAAGYSDEICDAVDCLTRRAGEKYEDMIARIKPNPLARLVKLADLNDNLDPNRTPDGDPEVKARLEKYRAALERLQE